MQLHVPLNFRGNAIDALTCEILVEPTLQKWGTRSRFKLLLAGPFFMYIIFHGVEMTGEFQP